ncbi:MAG: hypothetical protein WAV04_03505 [Candidatus Microsaccharimonas sp.]
MQLSQETINTFIGGQIEIINTREEYHYRGEIQRIWLDHEELAIEFRWFAQRNSQGEWSIAPPTLYRASRMIYAMQEISEGRVFLKANNYGFTELATLFPKGGSRLDPAKVRGLNLV